MTLVLPPKNPRHERFAQVLAGGQSVSEAYRLAGYRDDKRHASRLATKGHISARVPWFKIQSSKETVMDLQDAREMLAVIVRDPHTRVKDVIAAIRADNELAGEKVSVCALRTVHVRHRMRNTD